MTKKVGIVIPSYNQGRFLRKTIESVLRNAENVETDIAVIDGGSNDESVSIIREYSSRITFWCSEPDGGQANAINKGIFKLPDCKYYLWLNSDDIFESDDAVKKIVDFAEKSGYEVCYGKSHFIDEEGNIIGEYPVEPFDYDNLGKRCFLSQPSVMFSRKAYEETGRLNENLKMCLDYEYWMRLARKYKFGYLEEYIGATRMYGETKTATMQQTHLNEAITVLMRYYGKVPMHWIATKILADHPNYFLERVPGRILRVMLYPLRPHVIRQVMKEKDNDKNFIQ